MDLTTIVSSAGASIAGFFVTVWSFIVGVFLFIPRLVHNLAVPPDDDDDHAGGHLLVWEFGQVRISLCCSTPRSCSCCCSCSCSHYEGTLNEGVWVSAVRRTDICRRFCARSPSRRGRWTTSYGSQC